MITATPIQKIDKIHYSGRVYNLELQSKTRSMEIEDQYFIDGSTGLITHNCFPKDLSALLHFGKNRDIPMPVLQAVWNRNTLKDRPEKDWEQLTGRAVKEQ